jgi:hypothetical protein
MAENVIMTGPVFDGRAPAEVKVACRDIEEALAGEASRIIKEYLPTQYKYLGGSGGNPQDNPVPPNAGYYVSQIHTEASAEGAVVTDTQVIYGPWLEGVSSRNQATRFPGYGAFRKATQTLEVEAGRSAETTMAPHIVAMNGL